MTFHQDSMDNNRMIYLNFEVHRMVNRVHAWRTIDTWKPHKESPTKINSSSRIQEKKEEYEVKHGKKKGILGENDKPFTALKLVFFFIDNR